MVESLECRRLLSADGIADLEAAATTAATDPVVSAVEGSRHHVHHLHADHHQHALHEQRRQESHRHHVHTVHHKLHVLNTTVPEPIVLTAQERNDWATIRDQVLANRGRVPK